MYKIYADNILIYDDTSADPYVKVASPKLTLELGAAGSLKLTIPPGNAGYSAIALMSTTLTVEKDDAEIWEGRVLQEEQDFWNQRILTCEGALAYLNDTAQGQTTIHKTGGYAASMALSDLIAVHNLHAPSERQFTIGEVYNASTEIDFTTDFESTMEAIMKYLVEAYGGYLRIRKIGGTRYIDWLADIRTDTSGLSKNTQKIEFGKNLMDFTGSFDLSTFATVILPLGKKKEKPEGYDGPDEYTTVESVSPDNKKYVKAANEVYSAYGWIERVIHWDDIDDPQTLYNTAVKYLTETQFDTMELSLSAFDLHYLNPKIEGVKLGDLLDVISPPHGLDITLPVQKLEVPLDQPQNTIFQLGGEVKSGFTSSMSKINDEILQKLTETVDTDAILEAAKANTNAIMSQVLNGYVTLETDTTDGLHSEALYISDSKPILPKKDDGTYQAQRFWRWNMNGLGYTDDYGASWKTAITMDGSIVGERIAAGSIHGSKITAGTLDLVTSTGESGLSIGLSARGMAPGSFMIGDIDDEGKDMASAGSICARTILKIYLAAGKSITLKSPVHSFEVFEYTDNDDPESGFTHYWGAPANRRFTPTTSDYYRFVVRRSDGGTINQNELETIAAAFEIDGSTAVIRASDLKIIGMVTLTDVSEEGSTIIHGGNIQTRTIKAGSIDLYSGLTVTNNDPNSEQFGETSFAIDTLGNVTVNGNITLGEGSSISWDLVTGKPTYIGKDKIFSPTIEGGTITGGTITGETIEGGTISGTNISGSTFEVKSDTGNIMFYKDSQATRAAGIITYYTQTSQSDDSPEGLAITAYAGHALKLTGGAAGGGLSLNGSGEGIYADDLMLLDHGFATKRGVGFGTSAQRNALGTVREGYLFFQID